MTTGQKIYELRKNAHITQEQFADKLNVTRQAVSKWESDAAYPETDKIAKIAELFGVSCDYLLKDDAEINDGILAERRRSYLTMMVSFALACVVVGYVVAIICYFCIDMSESPLIGLGVFAAFLLGAFALWQAGRYHFLNTCDYSEKDKAHLARFTKVYFYVSIIAFFCYLPTISLYGLIDIVMNTEIEGALGSIVQKLYVRHTMTAEEFFITFAAYGGAGWTVARIVSLVHNKRLNYSCSRTEITDGVLAAVVVAFAAACLTVALYWNNDEVNELYNIGLYQYYTGLMVSSSTVLPAATAVQAIVHKVYDRTRLPLFILQLCCAVLVAVTIWFGSSSLYKVAYGTGALLAVSVIAMTALSAVYAANNRSGAGLLRLSMPVYLADGVLLVFIAVGFISVIAVAVCLSLMSATIAILYAIPFRARKK